MLTALVTSLALIVAVPPPQQGLTVQKLLEFQRIADPQVSPDGKWVLYEVSTPDLAANKSKKDVWLAAVDGSSARPLASHDANDFNARWLPDGKAVVFLSARTGSMQVWQVPVSGGEARQLSDLPLDVEALEPFPDGKRFLIALDVYPDLAPANALTETKARAAAEEKPRAQVLAYDTLLYRHWDQFEDGRRSHLFVWTPGAAPVDLMAGLDADCPTKPFGGPDDFAISPDGSEVTFTVHEPGKDAAWSTNLNLYKVPAKGGKPVALTAENKAMDGGPAYSPDGKTLAYVAMQRPQYESDRRRVVLLDRASGKKRVLTEKWDRSATSLTWTRDGKALLTSADHLGHHAIFRIDVRTGAVTPLVEKHHNKDPRIAGNRLLFARDHLRSPVELMTATLDGKDVKPVTRLNAERLNQLQLGETEQYSFAGANGDTVYGWLIKPADPKGGEKVPVMVLIHGGPQGSFGDLWHYRWNAQTFAGAGFAVLMIDFHGSTGYGQAFTDAINGNWGGAPYEDVLKGLDAALKKYPLLDGERVCAAGASYGGYLINWIAGQTDRFDCLVNHDGLFNVESSFYETEELWFPEWEFQGTPWENRAGYAKWNPKDHVAKWKTPMLVVHGGKDFRVVESQGMSAFTALQRRGIPSRFLYFPGENHWVLRPQNVVRWYDEVIGWLGRWAK